MPEIDSYQILGVDRSSSQAEIKKAHQDLVKQWHPDKHKGNKKIYQQKISEINKAFENIGTLKNRKTYDAQLEADEVKLPQNQYNCDSSISTMSSSSSDSSSMNPEKLKQRLRELNEHMRKTGMGSRVLDTDSDDSDSDSKSSISSKSTANSSTERLNRAFAKLERDRQIEQRDFEIWLETFKSFGDNEIVNINVTLEEVNTGVTKTIKVNRKMLQGNSELYTANVNIDKNVEDGKIIVVKGRGHYLYESDTKIARGSGDLIIKVNVIKHKTYTRKGYDLFTNCEITLDEAKSGFERKLCDLNGEKFTVKFKKIARTDCVQVIPGLGLERGDGSHGNINVGVVLLLDSKK